MTLSCICMECRETIRAETNDALAQITIAHYADNHHDRFQKLPKGTDTRNTGSAERPVRNLLPNSGDRRMTTHGCGYQPGDDVTVDIGGWTISGTITKLSPFRIYVDMNGCKQAVEPSQVTAEVR